MGSCARRGGDLCDVARAQLGARLESAADDTLLPLRAAKAVSLESEKDEAPVAGEASGGASSKTMGKTSGSGSGSGRRVYQRRPAECHVPGCAASLGDGVTAYCLRCTRRTLRDASLSADARRGDSPRRADRICDMHLRAEHVLFNGEASRYCAVRSGRLRGAAACLGF